MFLIRFVSYIDEVYSVDVRAPVCVCLRVWVFGCLTVLYRRVFSQLSWTLVWSKGEEDNNKNRTLENVFVFILSLPFGIFFITAAACLELLFEIFYILKQKKKQKKRNTASPVRLIPSVCVSQFYSNVSFSFSPLTLIFIWIFFFCIRLLSQSINNFSSMPSAFV